MLVQSSKGNDKKCKSYGSCAVPHLVLIDIYIKSIEDVLNRFQFTDETQNCVPDKFYG